MITLADFAGEWHISRRIDDAYSDQTGRFVGTARFSMDGTGLRYVEVGELRLGTAPAMQAERSYLWAQDNAGRIAVRFDDGRDFHSFVPGEAARADHLCGADLYQVRYDFGRWPEWNSVWCVGGPRKAYEMTSTYNRC